MPIFGAGASIPGPSGESGAGAAGTTALLHDAARRPIRAMNRRWREGVKSGSREM